MVAAFYDGDGGYQGQLGLGLEILEVGDAAVAHGGLDLVEAAFHIVVEAAGVGHVGVHALLKAQLGGAAQVVALPVPGTVGAFAPVFLHVGAVDHHLVGGALVEPGEVTAQHQEICAHGQSQGHVVVVDNAAVGADGHIDAGLLEVLVPGCGNLNKGRSLASADALGLPGDADGAAADAHLHKVRTGSGQEQEAVPVHHVAGTDFHGVAVGLAHPFNGLGLPAAVAFGGVDAQHVRTGGQQGGNPGLIVPGVDAGTHQVALLVVQQLQGVGLVGGVVLPEYEVHQVVIVVHHRQGVELVLPDNVVGGLQGGVAGGGDELFPGGHEGLDLLGALHPGDPVVPAGDDAQELAGGGAVIGDGHGGEAVGGLESQHIVQGVLRGQIGGGNHKAGLVALHLCHHLRLGFNGLRAVDEAEAPFLCQGNGQGVVGHGLHDGRGQGNIQADGRLLQALAVLGKGGLEADIGRNAVLRGVAGNQQIFAEGVTGFRIVVSHGFSPPVSWLK